MLPRRKASYYVWLLLVRMYDGDDDVAVKVSDVNARDDMGRTPLHYAVLHENAAALITLIMKNTDANINAQDDEGNTPLHLAAAHDTDST